MFVVALDIAYEVLRTLRTANIAAVVDRLTPLLHMDPVGKLPPEITSQIFSYLDASTCWLRPCRPKHGEQGFSIPACGDDCIVTRDGVST